MKAKYEIKLKSVETIFPDFMDYILLINMINEAVLGCY